MALRILKKFDELDVKEKEMTGRRRRYKPFVKNIGNSRPKSSNMNRGKRETRKEFNKRRSRRPRSAGPVRRGGASDFYSRNQQVHVSPSNRPLAPEVDNVFNSTGDDVVLNESKNNIPNSKHFDNNRHKKRIRPASAGPPKRRIQSDRFNDNKHTTYGSWNRNKLQRGIKDTNTFGGGKHMTGTSIVNLAKRIIKPEFYFLRICLQGITEKYQFKKFNVQITDLTNTDRPSHWYTDLETQADGHLIFRKQMLNIKSKMSTKTVMSPLHDFYWVKNCTQLYGHAIRIEVFEQVGEFQCVLIDRCAYFGKFDPTVIAEANKLLKTLALQQKHKKKRPTTAPLIRTKGKKDDEAKTYDCTLRLQQQPVFMRRKETKVAKNRPSSSTGLKLRENRNICSPRQFSGRNKEEKEKKKGVLTTNVYESKYNENLQPQKDQQSRVRLQRDTSPRTGMDSPVGKLSGWNDNIYSPSPVNRRDTIDSQRDDHLRQHASQSPPPKLDVIAHRHPSPYLKHKRVPLNVKRKDLNNKSELPPAFEVLKLYRKQIIERMKYTQAEVSHRRNRPTPPLLKAEGESMLINLSPTQIDKAHQAGKNQLVKNGKTKVVVPISQFLQ